MNNGQRLGPFTYDELWNQKISPKTLVWDEGMQNWQEAYLLPEFVNWFPKPIAVQPESPIQMQPVQNKSYRGVIGIVVFLIGIIVIYSFWLQVNSGSQSNTTKQDTSEKKISPSTNTQNHLVGTWKRVSGSFGLQFAFSANNTGTLTTTEDGESNTVSFSYSIRGNQLTIAWRDETDVTTFSIAGNKLTIRLEGETLIFIAK